MANEPEELFNQKRQKYLERIETARQAGDKGEVSRLKEQGFGFIYGSYKAPSSEILSPEQAQAHYNQIWQDINLPVLGFTVTEIPQEETDLMEVFLKEEGSILAAAIRFNKLNEEWNSLSPEEQKRQIKETMSRHAQVEKHV